MKIDIAKILNISARIAFGLLVFSMVLLFFPVDSLPAEVTELRNQYSGWLFVIFAFSLAVLLSYLIAKIVQVLKEKIKTRNVWKNYKYILQKLSDKEKMFLKPYYEKRETAIYFNLTDPVAKRLEAFQVISQPLGPNLGSINAMPGFIQPWVFELIDKNPKYLDIDEKKSKKQC